MNRYKKDFDAWNKSQKQINDFIYRKKYKQGDVWVCALGTNIGSEQDGTGEGQTRPALVIKNIDKKMCYIIPLTTSPITDQYRIIVSKKNGKPVSAMLSQIRAIDTKRLIKRMYSLDPCMFLYIREAARKLF